MTMYQKAVGRLKQGLTKLLVFCLPRHGKRAVFLTTLYIEISKISPTHKQLLESLNEKIGIVKDTDALLFPAYLHGAIWSRRPLTIQSSGEVLSEQEIEGICQRIIKTVPELSHYGDREKVMAETRSVVTAWLETSPPQAA